MTIKERAAMLKRDIPAVFLALKDGRPKRWNYALPVAAVWALAVVLILKAVF